MKRMETWPYLLAWLMIVAFLVYVAVAFSSCTTAKKATAYLDKHEDVAAPYCANKYPVQESVTVKDSLHTDTVFSEGQSVYVFDTLYVEGKPVLMKQQCPAAKTILQTKYQTVERVVENTAKVKAVGLQLIALQNDTSKLNQRLNRVTAAGGEAKQARNKWRLWCLLTWMACAGYSVFKVRKYLLLLA